MGPAAALMPNYALCCCAGQGCCDLFVGHTFQSWGMRSFPAASTLEAQQGTCVTAGASDILGLECAGVVEDMGEGVTRIQKGDRVCALLDGGGEEQQGRADTDLVSQCWCLSRGREVPSVRLTGRIQSEACRQTSPFCQGQVLSNPSEPSS